MTDEKLLLDTRTINAVLNTLNQPIRNATEACAIVRGLAVENGLELSNDTELSNGEFSLWMDRGGMVARALQAVSDLEDWCHNNEAEFSGWGDGEIPEGALRWTAQAKLALELIKDMADPATLMRTLPDGWFLEEAKHDHTRIIYAGDKHAPVPNPDGSWKVALQHSVGGRLTSARGKTFVDAWNTAVVAVMKREGV